MDKNLTVYPISTGDELNIFSAENMHSIRIMDMSGNFVLGTQDMDGTHNVVNIKELPLDTYIIEVIFGNSRSCRSVFVKT